MRIFQLWHGTFHRIKGDRRFSTRSIAYFAPKSADPVASCDERPGSVP